MFAIVKRVMEARSRREPAVLLLEDLHWFDRGSEAFLEVLVETATATRSLLVVNFRPEYHAGWMQKPYYQQLPLQPLTSESVNEMLHDLLGTDASLAGLAAMIRDRTGGTPFFIEEMVQTLAEDRSLSGTKGNYRLTRPVATLALPATVQAVLAARIDRLAEREKEVLQTAAVIGKEVPEAILGRVSAVAGDDLAAALRTLIAADFLYEAALYPDVEYTFKHPLTQEVTYHSQLGDRRARLHGSVARALQSLYADKLDERSALIAQHLEQAGEPLEAARWYARAAQWAGAHDQKAALRHWQRVRKLLAPISDSPEAATFALTAHTQILQLFWLFGASDEEAAIVFAHGKALANRLGDVRALANLMSGYAAMRLARGAEDHLEYAREAVRLADQTGDLALRRVVRVPLARSLMFGGLNVEGLACTEEGMDRLGQDPRIGIDVIGFNPYTMLADLRGDFLWGMGRIAEGAQCFEKALQQARDEDDLLVLGVLSADYGGNFSWFGEGQVALANTRRGVELAEKVASVTTLAVAYAHHGRACLHAGLPSEAVTALERSRAICRESRAASEIDSFAAAALAEAYAHIGKPDLALRVAQEAVAGMRRCAPGMQPFAQLPLARVLLCVKGLKARVAIEAALDETSRFVEEWSQAFGPFVCLERAELARLSRDEATRYRELRKAHRLFTEMGAPVRAAEVAKELGLATAS
jgi:adenylate cyclase